MIEDGKLGRHSSNNVIILEESVSRFHAEISLEQNKYYIKDKGSTTGTFIKIKKATGLVEEMIIEMGSN